MGERSRAQMLAYAAAAILVLVVGIRYVDGRGGDSADNAPAVALDGGAGAASGTTEAGGAEDGGDSGLYVHVAGAVRRAGLYRMPDGARVGAAVERAGGLARRAALGGVNLAAPLQDGQQVFVPKRGSGTLVGAPAGGTAASDSSASTGSSPGTGPPAAPISLSSATADQLDSGVEGIGPTLSARIIEFRDQQGGFGSIDQLREVDGIGEVRFEALKEAVTP